jgi:hypothetical protein
LDKKINEAIRIFKLEDEDITKIVKNYEHSNYDFFEDSEFDPLDRYIEEIIWREIEPILKTGDEIAQELLAKAGVDLDNEW